MPENMNYSQKHPENKQTISNPAEMRGNNPGYFVQVPVDLLKHARISPAALKLYMVLLSYCGKGQEAWPGQARLAQDMQLSERRVRSLLDELEKASLISVRHRHGSSNLYHLSCFAGKPSETEAADENFLPDRKKTSGIETFDRSDSSAESHESHESHAEESQHEVVEEVHLEEIQTVKTGSDFSNSRSETGKQNETEKSKELFPLATFGENESGEKPVRLALEKAGLNKATAKNLAARAVTNRRDATYIERLANWVNLQQNILNPVAYLATLVKRNADPLLLNERPGSFASRQTGLIDWSKFEPGGKYAYLLQA